MILICEILAMKQETVHYNPAQDWNQSKFHWMVYDLKYIFEWQLNNDTHTTSALVVEEAENLMRASEKQLKQCKAVILRCHVQ